MTSATTESKSCGSVASDHTSPTFPSLPIEIVRLVFEASVTPGLRADDEQQRQRTAHTCCLVSKDVKDWVEPLLYEKVVLESRQQVMSFLRALEIKPAAFLARAVKTVWLLHNLELVPHDITHDTFKQLPTLFSRLPFLERCTCIEGWGSTLILPDIPKSQNGTYALRELTIINATSETAQSINLHQFAIQKLHLINCSPGFLDSLYKRALTDKVLLFTLLAIPQVFLDFTSPPDAALATYLKFRAIPLWTQSFPGSISILYIRASFPVQGDCSSADYTEADVNSQDRADHCDGSYSWAECFDSDIRRCGARLVLYTKLEAQAGNEVDPKDSYIDQCKTWLGLH